MLAMKMAVTGAASFAGAVALAAFAVGGREAEQSRVVELGDSVDSLRGVAAGTMSGAGYSTGRPNVLTDFNEDIDELAIDPAAFVDPLASVIGPRRFRTRRRAAGDSARRPRG